MSRCFGFWVLLCVSGCATNPERARVSNAAAPDASAASVAVPAATPPAEAGPATPPGAAPATPTPSGGAADNYDTPKAEAEAPASRGPSRASQSREEILHEAPLSNAERALLDEYAALLRSKSAERAASSSSCPEGCNFQKRICELSEKICVIAARHPKAADISDKCQDGRERCKNAKHVTQACACSAQ